MSDILIGQATEPNGLGGFEQWNDTYNQAAELLTMPEHGRITRVGFWTAGINETASARGVVWRGSDGAVIGQSDLITIASRAVGYVDLYTVEILDPPEIAAGATFYAGFARAPTRSHQLIGRASGQHYDRKRSTWPGSMAGADTGGHGFGDYAIGCHAYYEPMSGAWIRRSGAWVRADSVQIRRSGAWAEATSVQIRRSGAWSDAD